MFNKSNQEFAKSKLRISYCFLCCFMMASSQPVCAKLQDLFKGKTSINDPFSLRDPFRRPMIRKEKNNTSVLGKKQKGEYSNLKTIGKVKLEELTIVGVLIGKERRAIVKVGKEPNPFILKEGMRLGENNAEIKAIVPGGIILVEKVTNIYGEDEYLETVIPISK